MGTYEALGDPSHYSAGFFDLVLLGVIGRLIASYWLQRKPSKHKPSGFLAWLLRHLGRFTFTKNFWVNLVVIIVVAAYIYDSPRNGSVVLGFIFFEIIWVFLFGYWELSSEPETKSKSEKGTGSGSGG